MPNIGAATSFAALWDAFKKVHGREPRDDEPVFVNASGERAQSYKKSLNALLEAAKLQDRRVRAGSFRLQLQAHLCDTAAQEGHRRLAINMRTSVRMIEMYYSDVVPEDLARQLEEAAETPMDMSPVNPATNCAGSILRVDLTLKARLGELYPWTKTLWPQGEHILRKFRAPMGENRRRNFFADIFVI